MTSSHIAFLGDMGSTIDAILDAETVKFIRLREGAYRKQWAQGMKLLEEISADKKESAVWLAGFSPPAVSDICRIVLNGAVGSATFLKWAAIFDKVSQSATDSTKVFYALFFGGRLYDKAGKHSAENFDRLFRAAKGAPNRDLRDDAIYYYLNARLRDGTDSAVAGLRSLSQNSPPLVTENSRAFNSFFEKLSYQLLDEKKWDTFVSARPFAARVGGPATASKYSYIAGRLIEEGFVKGQGKAGDLFRAAAQPGGDAYYQLAAGLRLGLARREMEKWLLGTVQEEDTSSPDREVEKVLRSYADHGFFERIYPEWLAVRPWLSADTGFALAKSLQNAPDEEYWVPGLRMAAWYGRGITMERLRLQYPRFYLKEIQHGAAEFALPERLLFGLVRSESYFIREVRSRVQAGGLTQLMPATATAIARELGVEEYDVNEATTNVRFGAYYLSEQIKTRNGSYLEALCAYNAGPHRIRAWRRTNTNPPDLLLETIPFAETRGYGRTNTASVAHYGWLYDDMNPLDVAAEMLK